MNDKGNKYALAALRNKRATISSEILEIERQLRHRRESLVHVDAVLQILDPDLDPGTIPNKRLKSHLNLFKQGGLSRLIMTAFRESDGQPVQTADIVTSVMKNGGFDETARKAMALRVRGSLAYHEKQGKIFKIGERLEARWGLTT